MYIIYAPNLGSMIAVLGREREQGRFGGSSEGARGRSKRAQASVRDHYGAVQGSKEAQQESTSEREGSLWGSAREQRGAAREY